jgi:hypothetical protein
MARQRKSNGGQRNAFSDKFEEIAESMRARKRSEDKHKTYNEGLMTFLPDYQKPYTNSWQFVDLCLAFRELTEEYTQENRHKIMIKRHAFDHFCKSKIEEKIYVD